MAKYDHGRKRRQPPKRVTAYGELRPEIDWDRFAWAVLQAARAKQQRDQAQPNSRETQA